MQARVEVDGEWSSIRYEWRLNGQSFGPNAAEVVLPTLSSGDEIRLRVTPYRAAARGESFEIGSRVLNQKPIVRNLSLERVKADDLGPDFDLDPDLDEAQAGLWRVVARVEDPDDDDVEIEYRWWLNGVESDVEGASFPASQLTRGDRLEVELRASDGELWSAPTRSGEIEVGNAPPSIVSLPPRPDPSGFFEYAIRAEDPDGDENLRFALATAPRGMQIDEVSGVVRWRPSADQAGRHPIEVVVRDGRGGEATQSFSLALVGVTESDAPGPAAAR